MKILVVDDERELGVLLGLALRRLGHVPLLALHPEDALRMVTPDVDAVVTDIHMPGMNGVELARRIRELDPDMPIAFCTGSDPTEDMCQEAATIGAVLPKVTTKDQVQELLGNLRRAAPPKPTEIRREKRHRTRVSARYGNAREFARQYTENLSHGGMFIRGAYDLKKGEEVDVEVELPGQGSFEVTAEVAFVLPPEVAESSNRTAGAGLRITSGPEDYAAALTCYLERLERRQQFVVFATDEQSRAALEEAGYTVMEAPPPAELISAIARCDAPVVGVIVPRHIATEYEAAAAASGDPDLVRGVDYLEELDEHIAELDQVL